MLLNISGKIIFLNKGVWEPVVYKTPSSINLFILKRVASMHQLCRTPLLPLSFIYYSRSTLQGAASSHVLPRVCLCLSLPFSQVLEWSSITQAAQLFFQTPALLASFQPLVLHSSLHHRQCQDLSPWLEVLMIKLVSWAWLTFSKDIFSGG